jgi:hypothetical protein
MHAEHTRVELTTVEGNRIAFRSGKWCVLSRDETWVLARHSDLGTARQWRKERYVRPVDSGSVQVLQGASRHIHLLAATGTIRTAMFEDREHTVVPVVALVEGVIFPVNAKSAELVLAEEFGKTPQGWNGRPVVSDHPAEMDKRISANEPTVLGKHAFGTVFNTRVSGKRLLMEAWIDRSKAEKAGVTDLLKRIDSGEMLEVSVGAFVVAEEKSGTFNGQKYSAIWREIVPDHLALLPQGTVGACSIKMGCGTPRAAAQRFNAEGDSAAGAGGEMKDGEDGLLRKVLNAVIKAAGGEAEGGDQPTGFKNAAGASLSDSELRKLLDAALRSTEPGYLGVDSVFPKESTVVYAMSPDGPVQLFKRGFSITEGAVSFADTKDEVKAVTRFEPVGSAEAAQLAAASCGCSGKVVPPAQGGSPMALSAKGERLKKLLETSKATFAEADIPTLEKVLSDTQLTALEAAAAPPAPVAAAPAAVVVAPAAVAVVEPAKPKTPEEEEAAYLAAAPPSIRKMIEEHKARAAARKTELVAAMQSTKQTAYSEAELQALDVPQLEKLVTLTAAAQPARLSLVNMSGVGLPASGATDQDTPPPAPDWSPALKAASAARQKA